MYESTHVFELAPGHLVGGGNPCFIIAEIGQNHQGEMDIAMKMIKAAANAKCDCVKFQKSYAKAKFTHSALSRIYESPHSFGTTYGEHKAKLELSDEQFYTLQRFADNEGILFSASAMDRKSVDFLDQINVPFIKIGSGDTNNYPLIQYIADKKRPVILSTGMHDLNVVQHSYDILTADSSRLGLLQCVSSYPTPPDQVNLNVIRTYQQTFKQAVVGYSGHEKGTAISVAAVALGAKIIERHFTLDNSMKGNDHGCSLEPQDFACLIDQVRQVEQALGSCNKQRESSELACYQKLGKSVVSRIHIDAGSVIMPHHLDIKVAEPNGIEAHKFYEVVGRQARRAIAADEAINDSDIE